MDFELTWRQGPLQRWLGPLPRRLHGPSSAEFVASRAALTRHPRQFWEEVGQGRAGSRAPAPAPPHPSHQASAQADALHVAHRVSDPRPCLLTSLLPPSCAITS